MSDEVWLLLIGAGIGLSSSIIGAVINHFLSLRAERKKREWDREERELQELRSQLLAGVNNEMDRQRIRPRSWRDMFAEIRLEEVEEDQEDEPPD